MNNLNMMNPDLTYTPLGLKTGLYQTDSAKGKPDYTIRLYWKETRSEYVISLIHKDFGFVALLLGTEDYSEAQEEYKILTS